MATSCERQRDQEVNFKELRATKMKPELLSGPIPPGHIPKPIVMPDYVAWVSAFLQGRDSKVPFGISFFCSSSS